MHVIKLCLFRQRTTLSRKSLWLPRELQTRVDCPENTVGPQTKIKTTLRDFYDASAVEVQRGMEIEQGHLGETDADAVQAAGHQDVAAGRPGVPVRDAVHQGRGHAAERAAQGRPLADKRIDQQRPVDSEAMDRFVGAVGT